MHRLRVLITFGLAVLAVGTAAQSSGPLTNGPTIDDLIPLKRVGSPAISPDGKWVAYTVRETNWDDNRYETEVWLADAASGATRQLTNGLKSSDAPAWSPDGKTLAFRSDRTDVRQIYLISPQGGESEKLTSSTEGVESFQWSPEGKVIAYTARDPRGDVIKDREKKYGEFDVIDQDYVMSHLYVVDVATGQSRQLKKGAFTVGRFDWSPNAASIAFDHTVNPDPAAAGTGDISVVTVADAEIRSLVTQDEPDRNPVWSPDGSRIAFEKRDGKSRVLLHEQTPGCRSGLGRTCRRSHCGL